MTEVEPSPDLVVLADSKQDLNLESYSLIDQPPELSIDPASVCPDEDTTTSEDISVLEERDAVSSSPEMGEKSGEGVVTSEDSGDQIAVSEEMVEEADLGMEEEEAPVEEEVVMEELLTAVEEQPPVVELELAPEVECQPPEVTLEDVTVEAVPEVKSDPPVPVEPVKSDPPVPVEPVKTEQTSEPEKSADQSSESDVGSTSDVGIPDVELKPEETKEEETDTTPKSKPICHIVSSVFLMVSLAVLSSAGEEHLPNRTEAALSSLLLPYLLTYAAADQEILTVDKLPGWLNALFNLVVCPFLVTYLGYTVSTCTGMCDLGLMVPTLGALLGVELWVLVEHLEVRAIAQGVAGTLGGVILHNHFRGLGEAGKEGVVAE